MGPDGMQTSEHQSSSHHAIAVVGGGLSGLTAALALAPWARASNQRIALVAARQRGEDGRTTALLRPSIDVLDQLGVWEGVEQQSAPLATMRLIDDTDRLFRAPLAEFHASEIGQTCFGYNVPNSALLNAMEHRIGENTVIDWIDSTAETAEIFDDCAQIRLADGAAMSADFAIAADGRGSLLRQAAGIGVKSWHYPQTALVLNFSHELPHGGASNEFHTPTGPFTQVPLPPTDSHRNRSSLVWVIDPSQRETIMTRTRQENERAVEKGLHSIVGKVTIESEIQSFDLSGFVARRFALGRTFLVGETGHAFPPIGAQGFNLSLRDVEALAKVFHGAGESPDPETLTARYHRSRSADVVSRTYAVDAMNRSLLSDFLPVQFARSAAIATLSGLSPLRKLAMRLGMGEGFDRARERWSGQA